MAKSNFLGASNLAAGPGEVGYIHPPVPVEAPVAPVAVEAAAEPEAPAEVAEPVAVEPEPEPEPEAKPKGAPALAKKAGDGERHRRLVAAAQHLRVCAAGAGVLPVAAADGVPAGW